ncbi:MAG: two pore domain potassium channel family protein [bacterium]|nr:two pore domain potassium channel family protein [bacterium]
MISARGRQRIATTPYVALLASMLLILFLGPWEGLYPLVRGGVVVATLLVMISALRCVAMHRGVFVVILVAGLASAVMQTVDLTLGMQGARLAGEALMLVSLVGMTGVVLSHILSSEQITMDTVIGTACVYLLLGFAWAKVYYLVELVQPGSFNLPAGSDSDPAVVSGQLLYYSMITLTTVGYGDVAPQTPPARSLAMLQGLVGQLYIAIMIARMVALQVAHRKVSR